MPDARRYPIAEVQAAATRCLVAAGASESNADSVARSLVEAEAEGNRICGLYYLPACIEQVKSGRVDGQVRPSILRDQGASFTVDAGCGLAQPAFDLAVPLAAAKAREHGVAAFSVVNSYHALALGFVTGALARQGLVSLGFANAPGAVSPAGATRKLFGTNPISLAAPLPDGGTLLIDQSASIVAKTEIMMRAERGEAIPEGWAQGPDGKPTTDPKVALQGSILPNGGIKGTNIALMVEVMAAVLTGSTLSNAAPPLGDTTAPHPRLGHFFLAIDPASFGGADTMTRMGALQQLIEGEPGLRLPGARRAENRAAAEKHGLAVAETYIGLLGLPAS